MAAVRFLDKDGTFTLDKAENYSYLYLPVANEKRIKSSSDTGFWRRFQSGSEHIPDGAGECRKFT